MAFNWEEYLNLARFLHRHTDPSYAQEAAFRSLVSRAYYAAYNHALNHAVTNHSFVRTNKPQDHQRLREHYRSRGNTAMVSILDELRQWRNKCDYNGGTTMAALTAMTTPSISKVERVFRTLI